MDSFSIHLTPQLRSEIDELGHGKHDSVQINCITYIWKSGVKLHPDAKLGDKRIEKILTTFTHPKLYNLR